jgi:uncharacterized OB-fold protein
MSGDDFASGPFPEMDREEYKPFWKGAREGRLYFPRCHSCERFHWYPSILCPHCQSKEIEWTPIQGQGKVYTWTVVRHPFHPSFQSRLPLIVALVEFEDAPGIRLVTNIIRCKPEEVYVSMPVEVIFLEINKLFTMPVFKPVHE